MDAPCLFLSHSGAQKDFARRLYLELLHVGHSAFFDEDALDSLPKGQPFPPRIVQACRGCRIGIVVLSDQYLESLWPMLELEQLTFYNQSSSPCILYPLFYSIPPADLSNKKKLRQWQATWDSKALEWQSKVKEMQAAYASTSSTSHLQISINISSWPVALERLRPQSGDVFCCLHMDERANERAYIQKVVSNICKSIPPPRAHYLLDEHIKGMVRLQEEIDDLFQQALPKSGDSMSAVCLGVWGLGGSGKTTLCKNMANFYRRDFPGRSCLLALPTEKDEKQLVEAIKEVILALVPAKKDQIERVSSVEMIMSHLEDGLRGHEVFLAIDNVWDWTRERAKQIALMACKVVGSKILVTSRSKEILPPICRIVPVPSITEDEAVEVLKCLSFCLPAELELDLKDLAQLCFFEGQCHPLLLKTMGDTLRRRSGRMDRVQGWKDIISRLQTCPMDDEENTIMEVLETSFLALTPKLQNIFIDLVTCTPVSTSFPLVKLSKFLYGFTGQCRWLSMIHDGFTKMDMRDQLIELEYHGLLEIKEDKWISIHDLHKNVARRRAGGRDACFFEGSLSGLSKDKCRSTVKYAYIASDYDLSDLMRFCTNDYAKLEILVIEESYYSDCRISVQNMQCLRFLELNKARGLKEIEGWEGTPNLVSIRLQNLGDMGCLPSLGQKPKLQALDLSGNRKLKDVSRTVCSLTALRRLTLAGCEKLEQLMPDGMDVCPLTALEKLDLRGCDRLKTIPDLSNLERLKVVRGAYYLPKFIGGRAATSLQVLEITDSDYSTYDVGPLCNLGAFINLRELSIWGGKITNSSLDVSGLTSLERCFLEWFEELEEITAGADALPKLTELEIWGCPRLKRFLAGSTHDDDASMQYQTVYMKALDIGAGGHSSITAQVPGPAVFPTCLEMLTIRHCRSLTTLPPLPSASAALQYLSLEENESLTDVSTLTTPLPFLRHLDFTHSHSLRELPNLTHLTSLEYISLPISLDPHKVREKLPKDALML